MKYNIDAKVFTADDEKVGNIDRIVIDPDTKEVTNLVVQKGFIFTTDKVVPASLVDSATEERVNLKQKVDDLDEFPDFVETYYVPLRHGYPTVPVRNMAHSYYWYPPIGWHRGVTTYELPNYVVKSGNIQADAVVLEEGTMVFTSDQEHVGDIDRVFTDTDSGRISHIVISKGLFLTKEKLIPTSWIKKAFRNEIHLSVSSELVESLPDYEPDE
jgi:uncharacterized protein YrrD